VLSVGPQGRGLPEARIRPHVVGEVTFMGKKRIGFDDASAIADRITAMLEPASSMSARCSTTASRA
jgi:F-type H+-transporting ATPase subunit gamma